MLTRFRPFVLSLLLLLPVALQASPLENNLVAYSVTVDSEGNESFSSADNVQPGDTIEYQLSYKNISEAPLSQLRLDGVVPPETGYIDGTASAPEGVRLLASIDNGNSFALPPIKYLEEQEDGSSVEKIAAPDTYTNLRWEVESLAAGQEMVLKYRVQVR